MIMKLVNILSEIENEIKERLLFGDNTHKEDESTIEEIYNITKLKNIGDLSIYKKYLNTIFPNSKIKKIVFRQGKMEHSVTSGGIWFGESEEDVLAFTKSVRREIPQHMHIMNICLIDLRNPYYFESFWRDYIERVEDYMYKGIYDGREQIMKKLINLGHDGFIVGEDTWNDTGNEFAVISEQFVVFSPNQIYILGSNNDIELFQQFVSKQ